MEAIIRATIYFKKGCFPSDDQYFDLMRAIHEHPNLLYETALFNENDRRFSIQTRDDYLIEIVKSDVYLFQPRCWFNGYFRIPSSSVVLTDIARETADYYAFSNKMNLMDVELTYGDDTGRFGWDHAHIYDHNMYSQHIEPFTKVSGPVQILEEAIHMISTLNREESRLLMKQKNEKVRIYLQELMEKTWHPSRIEKWIQSGYDF